MNKKHRTSSRTGLLPVFATVAFFGLVGFLFANRAANPPETGPMGGLMYEANMQASGTAAAAGVEVDGAEVAMGQVPNNVTVVPQHDVISDSRTTICKANPA